MTKKELIRRYSFFLLSVLVNAFSIAVITKAMLGTSPISSVPYVLGEATGLTMGQYTIIMNLCFILLEMTMMKRSEIRAKWYELVTQVPVIFIFGSFIDVSLYLILPWLNPTMYILRVVTLLIGCFLLGLGISMEVKANVAMVTGEYLVQIISKFTKREFGMVKVCFDCTLVVIACTLSLIFLSGIEGVREGTVIAALSVGPISHFVYPYLKVFDAWLFDPASRKDSAAFASATSTFPPVITITRGYCSGGHQLGEMLARKLGIKFFDKVIISMAAEESHLTEKYISENEQRISSNALLNIITRDYSAPIEKSLCPADAIFVAQSKIIRRIASEQPCVIIGRLSDYVLKDYPGPITRIFCYCNDDAAVRRCMNEHNLDETKAKTLVERTNRERVSHYEYYTGRKWGVPDNYDIMINTGSLSLDMACDVITRLYHLKAANKRAQSSSLELSSESRLDEVKA